MTTVVTKPKFVTEEHLVYLDNLSKSEDVPMYGAAPLIKRAFPELSRDESLEALTYWIKTFTIRQQVIREAKHDTQG